MTSTRSSCDPDCTDSREARASEPTGDCNDNSATVKPGVTEDCDDGFDNNCNGQSDCDDSACAADIACLCADADGDGFCAIAEGGTDCNDTVAGQGGIPGNQIKPGATETGFSRSST